MKNESEYILNKDAFSSGQIGSKIWLCEELEKTGWTSDLTHIYGGWYGVTAFLLLSRGNFCVNKIRSLDIDPTCERVADMLNENWVWQDWKFKALTQDCNAFYGQNGDLVINTSTEHFDKSDWFDQLPQGTRVVLQGNDMPHEDHVVHSKNLNQFLKLYPLSETVFKGKKKFVYPNWSFTRFMVIGKK